MGRLTKYCYFCKDVKSIASFAQDKSRADGFNSVCRLCARKKDRELVERKTGKSVRVNKKRILLHLTVPNNHKECVHCHVIKPVTDFWDNRRTKDGKCYLCKHCSRIEVRANNFGMTVGQWESLSVSQNGVCAICGLPETTCHQSGIKRALAIDHCHETGKIRGLLCGKCNAAIAFFGDDIDVMASAISYLINAGLRGGKKSAG